MLIPCVLLYCVRHSSVPRHWRTLDFEVLPKTSAERPREEGRQKHRRAKADKNDGTGHCDEVKYDVEVTKYVSEDGAFLQLVMQMHRAAKMIPSPLSSSS